MTSNIAVIDYGMGNLHSVKKALNYLNVNPIITSTKIDIDSADKIILVGVGHFKKALENLRSLNIIDALNNAVLISKKLGISYEDLENIIRAKPKSYKDYPNEEKKLELLYLIYRKYFSKIMRVF